ncbi:hypothetical protein XELAEV_18024988mg [Xenopus laevis]|uniref:Uncharacterized protein n=1 Tax=Xenopus laevis TaxID=8355 RepID=A0A974HLX3_XENLA|nr:hypothetical protein XELAEV_18024988mg [Xenopus laevis]
MFSWIEKVIPQPPDTPRKTSAEAQEGCHAKSDEGLEKVVPQPSLAPKSGISGGTEGGAVIVEPVKVSPPTPVHTPAPAPVPESQPIIIEVQPVISSEPEVSSTDKGSGAGVMGWLMQGLGKVVPQPEHVAPPATKVEDSQTITLCPVEEICILPPSPDDNLLVEDLEDVDSHADETGQCTAPALMDTEEEGRAPTNAQEEMCRRPECGENDLETANIHCNDAKMELSIMSENNELEPIYDESTVQLLEDGTNLNARLQTTEENLHINEIAIQSGQNEIQLRGTNQEHIEKDIKTGSSRECEQIKDAKSEKNGHLGIGQCLNDNSDQCVEGWQNQDKEDEMKGDEIGSNNSRVFNTDNYIVQCKDNFNGKVADNSLSLEEQTHQIVTEGQSLGLKMQEHKKTEYLNKPQPEVETESEMALHFHSTEDMTFQSYGCEHNQQAIWEEQNEQETIKKQSLCELQSEKEIKETEAPYEIEKIPTVRENLNKTSEETDPMEKIKGKIMEDTTSVVNIEYKHTGFDEKEVIEKIDMDIQPTEKGLNTCNVEERQLSFDEDQQIQTEERETQTDERFSPPVQKLKSEHNEVMSQHEELVYHNNDKDFQHEENESWDESLEKTYEVSQDDVIESKHEASELLHTEQQPQESEIQNDNESQHEGEDQDLEKKVQNEKIKSEFDEIGSQSHKKKVENQEEKNNEEIKHNEVFLEPGEHSITELLYQKDMQSEERTIQPTVEIQIRDSKKRDSLEQQKNLIDEEMNGRLRKDKNMIVETD